MNPSFENMLSVQSSIEVPFDGYLRVLTVIVSSIKPVSVEIVDEDGVVSPVGELLGNPLRRARFRDISGTAVRFSSAKPFALQYDMQLGGVEPNSGIPAVEHTTPQKLTRREEIERAVMIALAKTRTMPTEEELSDIEGELGFHFDDDGMDWGQGFMEELDHRVVEPEPEPEPAPSAPEPARDGEDAPDGGDGAS